MIRSLTAAALLFSLPTVAFADEDQEPDSDISDAETSYTGATMLEGGVDVAFADVTSGEWSDHEDLWAQERYAFFTGNTLYVGTEDEDGNAVDAIVEFFWFESSIDRGSDFFVAVIKARTSPNVDDGFYLRTDSDPVLRTAAYTDLNAGNAGFRWDWSLPFEDYGMDSYGQVTLTNSYGIGGSAEGSAMHSESYDEDGSKVEGNVQAKGYVNSEYKVETQYQVTLYRWEMDVRGSPGEMSWEMTLNNGDRDEMNAYHEFFLVMQIEEEGVFTIDQLDIGGTLNNGGWFNKDRYLGVALEGLELSRPAIIEDEEEEEEEEEDIDTPDDEEEDEDEGAEWEGPESTDGEPTTELIRAEEAQLNVACSSTGANASGLAALGGAFFGLVALARRRD